jgi:hypothetical protein
VRTALDYATNRLDDDQYAFAACLNRACLWDTKGKHGWNIGPALAASPILAIQCTQPAPAGPRPQIKVSGEGLTIDADFVQGNGIVTIAAAIVREMLRDRGFTSQAALPGDRSSDHLADLGESCISSTLGIVPADKGFLLLWDGLKAGYEPAFNRADALFTCAWNRSVHPDKKVECCFDGIRLGYELYWTGVDLAARVGFEPRFSRTDAASSCEWNVRDKPALYQECLYQGSPVGFELFRDKVRVVQEPAWTKEKAIAKCGEALKVTSREKVACYFDGRGLGYEMFSNGKRVNFEPAWTASEAASHCNLSSINNPATVIECRMDGHAIAFPSPPTPSLPPKGPRHLRKKKPLASPRKAASQ